MITKIYGRNFKGQNFDQPLGQYTLFVGRNGAGKSARTQALAITILGYSPQTGDKQPGAIFHAFASANEMWVGIEIDSNRLGRRFTATHDGSVSQDFTHNGRRVPAKLIEKLLLELGSPRIFDLKAWIALSENKQIECLLSLSPPSKDLAKIERELSSISERENKVRSEARAATMVIEQLTAERVKIEIPAGTLAEVRAEIARLETVIRQAEEELKAAQLAEVERRAQETARIEAEVKITEAREEGKKEGVTQGRAEVSHQMQPAAQFLSPSSSVVSLDRVKKTLLEAGCQSCAALIVTNAEIRKHRKEEPHGNAA